MIDSKEKEEAKQENPDGNLGEEQPELKVSAETETELEVDKSISNRDISVETGIEDKSNGNQNVSGETEIEDKSNENQNISAETEIEDKSNENQDIVAEMEIEDKSNGSENISVEIEKEDKNVASREESLADVKTETRDDLSPPVQTRAEKDGVDDEEKIESAEAPPNPEIETREEEQEKPVPEAAEPISSVKLQAENSGDDNEDVKNNENVNGNSGSKKTIVLDEYQIYEEGSESGTEEDQSNFMKEIENFFRERSTDFKPPKFYGEGLNCLKLWRSVIRLGGYDKVTSCKLWRQVGESFRPPKTCTTVSWTFRGFYEKALLDYERHKTNGGELSIPVSSHLEPIIADAQASGSGRARRDAAARAMQGWHSQRLLGNGEVGDPIIKDKGSPSTQKREKQLKSIGLLKRKKPTYTDDVMKSARTKTSKLLHSDITVNDVGPRADWVKINVQRTKDCFEVYALVPGLLREEVRVQSDPAGWVVISGEPEQLDNPWGLTPFKKVVSLPSRIDSIHTSAVVTLHGQLFIRVPFEQSD